MGNRIKSIQIVTGICFLILLGRFFSLQVLSGSLYRRHSESNYIRRSAIPAARGLILDRNGRVLADNRPSYSLFVLPYEFMKSDVNAAVTAQFLDLSVEMIRSRIDSSGAGPFTPVRLFRDVPFNIRSAVEENRLDLSGLSLGIEPIRFYPSEASLSHVLGYLGEAGPGDFTLRSNSPVRGDIVGKTGIEKEADAILRGQRGYSYFEVDVSGRIVGNFQGEQDLAPVPGSNIMLTIDHDLQVLAEKELNGYRGAVVVADPRNGEILAMASSPDYDLLEFSKGIVSEHWLAILDDEQKPLLHRAIQAQLPPGSTFKIITALAALESGAALTRDSVLCTGSTRIGRRLFHCWKEEGHGYVGIEEAIKASCNVFFYELGMSTGIDKLAGMAAQFRLGEKVEFDLNGGAAGLLPDREYLDKKYGHGGWTRGAVANISVGQGDLLVTPLQMAAVTSAIANFGTAPDFHLLRAPDTEPGMPGNAGRTRLNASRRSIEVVHRGMFGAVHDEGGTARAAWSRDFDVCGKTGTAQNPQGDPHAWFLGFAPRKKPEIVVVTVMENAGSGSSVAAPAAGRIFRFMQQRRMGDAQ